MKSAKEHYASITSQSIILEARLGVASALTRLVGRISIYVEVCPQPCLDHAYILGRKYLFLELEFTQLTFCEGITSL